MAFFSEEPINTTFETSLKKNKCKHNPPCYNPDRVRANATSIKFALKKVTKALTLKLELYQDIRK